MAKPGRALTLSGGLPAWPCWITQKEAPHLPHSAPQGASSRQPPDSWTITLSCWELCDTMFLVTTGQWGWLLMEGEI